MKHVSVGDVHLTNYWTGTCVDLAK